MLEMQQNWIDRSVVAVGSQSDPRQQLEAQHKDECEGADAAKDPENTAHILPHLIPIFL